VFKPINYAEYQEKHEQERFKQASKKTGRVSSYREYDKEQPSITCREKLRRMFTVFPYRDPTYLVAILYVVGSFILLISALFDLIPRTVPQTAFTEDVIEELHRREESKEDEATADIVSVATDILLGSIFFFVVGILDTFGALNTDCGHLETTKGVEGTTQQEYKPTLLGSKYWARLSTRQKFFDLLCWNLAFQAGLFVLFGGIIFMFAGIIAFPGVISH
jgi:hypothetical protein